MGVATESASLHPLSIEAMRQEKYVGSELIIETTLPAKPSYNQYVASYVSDGFKQFGLLTVPKGEMPDGGYPAIVFNHGYIQPEVYRTTERYVAYVDALAAAGFVVFKPDYRGHGNSEGNPEGAYYSTAYTRDVLQAMESMKKFEEVNPERIGMWGHSMGGHITLRSMVVVPDIKVGVIWGGVVASYQDMTTNWNRSRPWQPSDRERTTRRSGRQTFIDQYGSPEQNGEFWNSISPITYVKDISGPVQIHHGLADDVVPALFSKRLYEAMTIANKTVEYYEYPGGDHNLSGADFGVAMGRTVEFFRKYL
jgi:dipeptidyl aminopeptidase/acylaminoacyl peptidase